MREKFAELFPHGDIEHYSDLLFETFDNDGNGTINFQVRVFSLHYTLTSVKFFPGVCESSLNSLSWHVGRKVRLAIQVV